MTIKSALSVVALTVALSGAAFAQGMTINGVAVSDADMGAVQERCTQLSTAAASESLAPTTSDADDSSTDDATDGGTTDGTSPDANAGNDAIVDDAPAVNQAQAATATIDLDTIDLQACIDGGFVTQ